MKNVLFFFFATFASLFRKNFFFTNFTLKIKNIDTLFAMRLNQLKLLIKNNIHFLLKITKF